MSTLTFAQALSYAQGAGFQGQSAYTIVAIAMAESSLNTNAQNCNNPGGTCDRGILQINNYWHKEVSDSCAYNPQCAFQQAYRIAGKGQDFTAWNTFTSGAYKKYIQAGAGAQPTPLAVLQQATSSNAGGLFSGFQANLASWGEKIAFFAIGIVFIFAGFFILIHPSVDSLFKGSTFPSKTGEE